MLSQRNDLVVNLDSAAALPAPHPRLVPAEAVSLHHAGKLHEAALVYQAVLERQPCHVTALNLLASIRQQQGDLEQAVRLLDLSLQVDPQQAPVVNNLGVAFRELEMVDKALLSFNRALTLSPNFLLARENRRRIEAELAALRRCEQEIATDPISSAFLARPPAYIFCYHKTGTILFSNVLQRLSARFGILTAKRGQLITRLPRRKQFVLFFHSALAEEANPAHQFRAVRIIRDPRDIWVSSYLYHRRCREPWCVHTQFDRSPPIGFPQADACMAHRPETWKQQFLARLDRKSYQQNLLDRDRDSGLLFELEGYTSCTLDEMRNWPFHGRPEVLEVKLEEICANFQPSMLSVFKHLGLSKEESKVALDLISNEDIGRMEDAQIAANPHIYSRQISKWRAMLSPSLLAEFERRFADLIVSLGYELSSFGRRSC